MRTLSLILGLVACGGAPKTLEGCATLSDAAAREDCRLEQLVPLFEAGDEAAFAEGLAQVDDPLSRDLVRLRLAVGNPHRAGHLCRTVETEDAQEKCRQVLGRPHLSAPRPAGPGSPPRPPSGQ
jgi:hypothetical protein